MTDSQDKEKLRNWYQENRTIYVNLETEQQSTLDKQLLALSTASLGFSLIVGEKISSLGIPYGKGLLVASWLALGISVISTVWSFFFAAKASQDFLEQFDANFVSNEHNTLLHSHWTSKVSRFNCIAISSFTIGIILVLSFAGLSLFKQENSGADKMIKKTTISEGTNPKQPSKLPIKKDPKPTPKSKPLSKPASND
ncbi:MAG: hypothetical protein V7727_02005 [Sneathiella sp.]